MSLRALWGAGQMMGRCSLLWAAGLVCICVSAFARAGARLRLRGCAWVCACCAVRGCGCARTFSVGAPCYFGRRGSTCCAVLCAAWAWAWAWADGCLAGRAGARA